MVIYAPEMKGRCWCNVEGWSNVAAAAVSSPQPGSLLLSVIRKLRAPAVSPGSAGVSSCTDGTEIVLWLLATKWLTMWCQHSPRCRGERVSFPADPLVFCLIGSLYSLSIPLLWQVSNTHSHLSPRSLQVKCEIHLFQGRNQSTLYPVTDHFVCSSK